MGETDIIVVIQDHYALHSASCGQRTSSQCHRKQIAFAEFLQQRGLPSSMEAVTSYHVAEFLAHLRSRGLSESTIRGYWMALDMLFRFFGEKHAFQDVHRNPVRGIPEPKVSLRGKLDFLTCEELIRLFVATSAAQPRAILATLLCTGMRASELTCLRVTDADVEIGTIRIRRILHRPFRDQARERVVPMVQSFRTIVADFIARHRPRLLVQECPWLFVRPGGRPFTVEGVYQILRSNLKNAGIHKASRGILLLRYTFGIRLLNAGVPLHEVAAILGHEFRPVPMPWLHLAALRTSPIYVLSMIDDPFAGCFPALPCEVEQ